MFTNKYQIINAALIAIAAILLFHIHRSGNEIERMKKAQAKADAEMQALEEASVIQNSSAAKAKSSSDAEARSSRKTEVVRPSQEEISRILERAKHDTAVMEAFKQNTNSGSGYTPKEIKSHDDCEGYWRFIESISNSQKRHVETLNQIISALDFSATSEEDMEVLDKYASLRKKYSDILYDESASPEELTETYNSLDQLKDKAKEIISNAITYTYGEKLQEYNKMKNEMANLVLGMEQQTIGVRHFGYNGKHYSVFLPDKED